MVAVERFRRHDGAPGDRRRPEPERDRFRTDGRGGCSSTGEEPRERLDPGDAAQARVNIAQTHAEPLPPAAEQRADGRVAESKLVGELVVRESADLAQNDRIALRSRQVAERLPEGRDLGSLGRLGERVRCNAIDRVDRYAERRRHTLPDPSNALVARDRRKPGRRVTRSGALQERAMRRKEHLLGRILRFGTVAQEPAADSRDRAAVVPVERVRSLASLLDLVAARGGRNGRRTRHTQLLPLRPPVGRGFAE